MSWTTYWYTYFNTSGYLLTVWQTSHITSTTWSTSKSTSSSYSVTTSSTGTKTTSWSVSTTYNGSRSTTTSFSTAVAINTTTSWTANTTYSRSTTTSYSGTTSWTTSWTTNYTTTWNTTYSQNTSHVTTFNTTSSWSTSRSTTTSWTTTIYTNTMLATSHNTTTSWTTTFQTSQQTTTLVPMQAITALTPYQVTTTIPQQFQTTFYKQPYIPDVEHDWTVADLSGTLTQQDSYAVGLGTYIRSGIAMSEDGTKLVHIMEYSNNTMRQWDLSTPYDIDSVGSAYNSWDPPQSYAGDLKFYKDGTFMAIAVTGSNYIYTYDLTTAWDLSTRTNQKSLVAPVTTYGINFTNEGYTMYTFGYSSQTTGTLTKFSLSTAYDITSTVTQEQSLTITASTVGVSDIRSYGGHMNYDGTQYIGVGLTGTPNVYKINFATGNDLASAKTYSAATASGRPGSPCVINNGTEIIWGDETDQRFKRFTL